MRASRATRSARVVPFAPKVTAPRIRPGTLHRSVLVERLCAHEATELFISAPAGYGKSTLLTLWAHRDERPFAWITADEGDNDPVVLLTYLALALESLAPEGSRLAEQVIATELPWPHMLASLADAVAAMTTPFVLVVDDVHELDGPSRTKVLPAIARRVPPGSTIALSTRGRRPYPASRGLLAGQTMELGVEDLSMDAGEAAALLRDSAVEVSREQSDALHDRTEGWPAGLYIAALALRNADDPERAVHEFTGGDRTVTDYVTEEILAAMPSDALDFLLSTAVLSRLSGELCDHALGTTGSGAVLDALARDNRFVIPLDHHGHWYRYHHLFGEVLLQAMRSSDPARVQAVARSASAWFAERGEVEPAVEHALAGAAEDAPALIWRYGPMMLATNRADTVALWLAHYRDEDIERLPELALTAAWERLVVGDMAAVHRYATRFETAPHHELPDGSPAAAAAGILFALTRADGLTAMRRYAAGAREGLSPQSPYLPIAHFLEGSAASYLGDYAAARELLVQGSHLADGRLPAVHAQCLSQLARVALAEDDTAHADRLVDEAVGLIDQHHLADRPPNCVCFSIAAVVHLRRGLVALGEAERTRGIELLAQAEDISPYQILGVALDLALASMLVGDFPEATRLLDAAERKLARLPDTGVLRGTAIELRARLESAQMPEASLVDPLSPAELRVLAYLPTHLTFGEIGELLFVSRNTVKSQAIAIYRKLAVSSRGAAVAEARRIGLLRD